MPTGLQLRILGPVELVGPAGAVSLGAAKERCLLAVLVVEHDRTVSRDRLLAALWDDQAPRTAVKALQNYVLRLRGELQATGGVRISTEPTGYRLVTGPGTIDAQVAEGWIAEARAAAAHDPGAAAGLLRAALGLWRGRALAEFADRDFARAECRRLDELYETAREDLVDADLARHRYRAALDDLGGMLDEQPLRERRWAQMMRALCGAGRDAEALQVFARLRGTLRDDLGVEPGAEVRELHERVLAGDPSLRSPRSSRPVRTDGLLRGRDAEVRAVCDRVTAGISGDGGIVIVVGEPGIGKSTLLRQVADISGRHGALVLTARCLEGDWHRDYHPFAEAVAGYATAVGTARLRAELGSRGAPLSRLVPELADGSFAPDRLDPGEERSRLLDVVAGFLADRCAERPVVLVLDDLQWADAPSLSMLRHVVARTTGRPLVVVGAYRSDEAGAELIDAVGALRAMTDVAMVRVGPIDTATVGWLAGEVAAAPVAPALAQLLAAQTRGNPFFVKELTRHLAESGLLRSAADGVLDVEAAAHAVPDGVRQVLARRRNRLSAGANAFLDHAAGYGRPFPFAVVATAAGLLDDDVALGVLDEVITAGLIEPDRGPERYAFGHALIRHAVYADLNPSRRARVHRRLADAALAAMSRSGGVEPAEVVPHYAASAALPGADAGIAPAVAAADRAEGSAAYADAADLLTTACELAADDDERRLELRCRLGRTQVWARRFDEAVDTAAGAAVALADTRGQGPAAEYLADVTTILASADSAPHAWRLARIGLPYAQAGHDAAWATLTLHDLDRREAEDPDFPGMILDVPERREALRVLLDSGRIAGRVDLERFALAATCGSLERIPADAAADPSVRLFLMGDAPGALPLFEARAQAAAEAGRLALEGYFRNAAARCCAALGHLDAAQAGIAEAADLARRTDGDAWGWQRIHAIGTADALAHVTDQGWDDVLAQLTEAFPAAGTGNAAGRRLEASAIACGAKAAARLGRAAEAEQLISRALPALRRAPSWATNFLRTLCDTVEAVWLLSGPGAGGHPWLAELEEAATTKALTADFRFPIVEVRLALARLAATGGRLTEARTWFARSRDVLGDQQAAPLRAIADLDAARVEAWAGDQDVADELRAGAVAAFTRLGMTGWLDRA